MDLDHEAAELVRRQWGLASRAQLTELGVSRSALRWAISRQWEVVLPGVVHVDRSPLRTSQRHMAALLYGGDQALITGSSAARWWGIRSADDRGLVRVVVPAPQEARRARWLQVRRTYLPEQSAVARGPLRYVSAERATVEAARECATDDEALAIVIEALQRRLVALDRLGGVNDALAMNGSARVRRALDVAASGAWSVPEADLVALTSTSRRLPPMWCNPVLRTPDGRRLTSPDGWFDDVGLAVMVHSQRHHAVGRDWETTIERDGDLRAAGIPVLPITPIGLKRHPAATLERIESTYASTRRLSQRAPVIATPRLAGWTRAHAPA